MLDEDRGIRGCALELDGRPDAYAGREKLTPEGVAGVESGVVDAAPHGDRRAVRADGAAHLHARAAACRESDDLQPGAAAGPGRAAEQNIVGVSVDAHRYRCPRGVARRHGHPDDVSVERQRVDAGAKAVRGAKAGEARRIAAARADHGGVEEEGPLDQEDATLPERLGEPGQVGGEQAGVAPSLEVEAAHHPVALDAPAQPRREAVPGAEPGQGGGGGCDLGVGGRIE
jgi:hypothetical protein